MSFTPWTEKQLSSSGSLDALGTSNVQCSHSHVLKGFVLEAKDPGASKSEIRYNIECCKTPAHTPVTVTIEETPIAQSFGSFDGIYFPTGRVEGVTEMAAGFLYATQLPSDATTVSFNKSTGQWCVLQGTLQRCTLSNAVHVLQIEGGAPFDVTPLKPLGDGSDDAPGVPALKSVKAVKFKKPPHIQAVSLKTEKLKVFNPSKEMVDFDMTTVANWMPESPQYKPYCSLRDAKVWKSQDDAKGDEASGWGVDARNKLEVLNTEDNKARTESARSDEQHPCKHYFGDEAMLDRPAFTTKFDLVDLTNVDKLLKVFEKKEDIYTGTLGKNVQSADKCAERNIVRGLTMVGDKASARQAQGLVNGVAAVGDPACSLLPKVDTLAAPMGIGVGAQIDIPEICKSVLKTTKFVSDKFWEKYLLERTLWERSNHVADARHCGNDVQAYMYKAYCDLHCVEDAVTKGNSAVLRSMKSLEGHIVRNFQDMLKSYTTEIFEKIKEAQAQINHNDGEMSDLVTSYAKQIMEQSTGYSKSLNTAVGGLTSPLNKIQKDLESVNKNLASVYKWLQTNDVLMPKSLLLHHEQPMETVPEKGNASLGTLQQSLKLASQTAVAVIHGLHSGTRTFGSDSFNENVVARSLAQAGHAVKKQAGLVKAALRTGDLSAAQGHLLHAVGEVQRAHAGLTGRNTRESTAETFQRRTGLALHPAHLQLLDQFETFGQTHSGLVAFHAEQRVIMGRAETLGELSEEAERYAAAEMIVRFDAEVTRMHRSFNDYLRYAQAHLGRRGAALTLLVESSKADDCASPETTRRLGVKLAEMDRSGKQYAAALAQTWRDTADSLTRMADLLVDGGLLVHFIRLAGTGLAKLATDREVASPHQGDSNHSSILAQTSGCNGVMEAFALLERPLREALQGDAASFIQQVHRAFTMSQLLAASWSVSGLAAPEAETQDLQAAWAKVAAAAQELRAGLRPGAALRHQLLLRSLEAVVGQAQLHYPVPAECKVHADDVLDPGVMLWRMEGRDAGTALLLSRSGRALRCDLQTKQVQTVDTAELGTQGIELGFFLDL